MKYSRFEDLQCWQKARELCQAVFKIINSGPFSKDFGLKDQIWRAAGSAMDNIAEGFDDMSTDDLASYYFEVLEAVEKPEFITRGNKGSLKATKNMGRNKWVVVIYREISKEDGFVITAYFLNKKPKGDTIWRCGQ